MIAFAARALIVCLGTYVYREFMVAPNLLILLEIVDGHIRLLQIFVCMAMVGSPCRLSNILCTSNP